MKNGCEVIHGGYLKKDKWRGEFDFLIKNNNLSSKFGNYSYEVIDTKNSKKTKSWKRVAEKLAELQGFSVFLDRVLPLPTVRL